MVSLNPEAVIILFTDDIGFLIDVTGPVKCLQLRGRRNPFHLAA
jgi:hypothetical protein